MLSKDRVGLTWKAVTAEEAKLKEKTAQEEKPDAGNSADPTAGIMGLMKKMYDDGDDKTKQVRPI